jgi:hypothetical protein
MYEPEEWNEFFKDLESEFSKEDVTKFISTGMSPMGLMELNDSLQTEFINQMFTQNDKNKKWKFLNQFIKNKNQVKNVERTKTYDDYYYDPDLDSPLIIINPLEQKNQQYIQQASPSFQLSNEILFQSGIINRVKQLKNNQTLKKNFEWRNIPMFSIVTGANGIGKTTLLNTIVSGYLEYDQKDKTVEINECTDNFELLRLDFGKTINAFPQSSRSSKAFEGWTQEYISKLKSYCQNRYQNQNVEENQEFEAIFKLIEPQIVHKGIDQLIKDFNQKSLSDFDTIPKLIVEYLKQNGVILFLQFTIGIHKCSTKEY